MKHPKWRPVGLWLSVGPFTTIEYRHNSLFIACYLGFTRRLTQKVGQMDPLRSQKTKGVPSGTPVLFCLRFGGFEPPSGRRSASAPIRQRGALPDRNQARVVRRNGVQIPTLSKPPVPLARDPGGSASLRGSAARSRSVLRAGRCRSGSKCEWFAGKRVQIRCREPERKACKHWVLWLFRCLRSS